MLFQFMTCTMEAEKTFAEYVALMEKSNSLAIPAVEWQR